MHYFLDPKFNLLDGLLSEDESRHAVKSLRIKEGDEILIGDGAGKRHTAVVISSKLKKLELRVISSEEFLEPSPVLSIAIAPTKNPSRFEWFLEKATEIGIDRIIPLQTSRTERHRFKADRAERIVHAATKQSLRAYIPEIQALTELSDFLEDFQGELLIAHCEKALPRIELDEFLSGPVLQNTTLLIGPEGDFTEEEIRKVESAGGKSISLGNNRLRTETAGVFGATILAAKRLRT